MDLFNHEHIIGLNKVYIPMKGRVEFALKTSNSRGESMDVSPMRLVNQEWLKHYQEGYE